MNIKKIILILSISILLNGCSLFSPKPQMVGSDTRKLDKVTSKITMVDDSISDTNQVRLDKIATYSLGGVKYSLDKITNQSNEVAVALKMNDRILTLAGTPSFNDLQAIKGIVDNLTSEIELVRTNGQKQLELKDKEIITIQNSIVELNKQKKIQTGNALKLAQTESQLADAEKAKLSLYTSYFGLGAIVMGIKQLFATSFWTLLIIGIIFLVLRFLSLSNPLAATIFSTFEHLASYVIKTIVALCPRVLQYCEIEIGKVEKFITTTKPSTIVTPVIINTPIDNVVPIPPK